MQFTANHKPVNAPEPVTFIWDNGNTGPTAVYTWPLTSDYTVVVTATGHCGDLFTDTHLVEVLYDGAYLPVVLKAPLSPTAIY